MQKNKDGIFIKSPEEIAIMTEGGKKLAKVKARLKKEIKEGVSAYEIEELAVKLIEAEGAKASFKMVPKYSWATCVNVNEGVVHGIPKREIVFEKGDVVSVDVGVYYEGFHTDTSFSLGIEVDAKTQRFLTIGKTALDKAVAAVKSGARVYDISLAMERVLFANGYSPIKALVGHGVGASLHEDPQIPCFVSTNREATPELPEGAVIAIEVMYSEGSGLVGLEDDRWTISTQDGKIAALYEETVAVTKNGPIILSN